MGKLLPSSQLHLTILLPYIFDFVLTISWINSTTKSTNFAFPQSFRKPQVNVEDTWLYTLIYPVFWLFSKWSNFGGWGGGWGGSEHFDIAIATCLPPNLQICLTFWPIHSQYLLRFSHTADVFKHMFLLQTYVQVSENNFFWVHLSDFSTKSIE